MCLVKSSDFFNQVKVFSFINMVKTERTQEYHQKVKNLPNMILYKLHPIIYTTRDFLITPKENKGSETTPQLRRTQFYSFKSSHVSLPRLPTIAQAQPLSTPSSSLPPALSTAHQIFHNFGIAQGVPNLLNISYHNLMVSPQYRRKIIHVLACLLTM
uniref:Putative ovule protein n=1 Tax=Solanum chacoense TaxID=4108 RepID=A0A0V0HCH7_SOLCH